MTSTCPLRERLLATARTLPAIDQCFVGAVYLPELGVQIAGRDGFARHFELSRREVDTIERRALTDLARRLLLLGARPLQKPDSRQDGHATVAEMRSTISSTTQNRPLPREAVYER